MKQLWVPAVIALAALSGCVVPLVVDEGLSGLWSSKRGVRPEDPAWGSGLGAGTVTPSGTSNGSGGPKAEPEAIGKPPEEQRVTSQSPPITPSASPSRTPRPSPSPVTPSAEPQPSSGPLPSPLDTSPSPSQTPTPVPSPTVAAEPTPTPDPSATPLYTSPPARDEYLKNPALAAARDQAAPLGSPENTWWTGGRVTENYPVIFFYANGNFAVKGATSYRNVPVFSASTGSTQTPPEHGYIWALKSGGVVRKVYVYYEAQDGAMGTSLLPAENPDPTGYEWP